MGIIPVQHPPFFVILLLNGMWSIITGRVRFNNLQVNALNDLINLNYTEQSLFFSPLHVFKAFIDFRNPLLCLVNL